MKFLSKLWFGEYSLIKTYWLCCVFIPILLSIPIKLLSLSSNSNYLILFFYLCLVSTYSFIALIGLWRSSNLYVGNIVWSLLAKLTVIIGFIAQFFLMVQTMLLDESYPIWYLVLVGALLFCFSLSVKENELYASVKTTSKKETTKELIDENNLWEQVAREFESSRNEGLWARLFVESNGDEIKAKVKYLALRFDELLLTANSKLPIPSSIEKTELNSFETDTNVVDANKTTPEPYSNIRVFTSLFVITILASLFLFLLVMILTNS